MYKWYITFSYDAVMCNEGIGQVEHNLGDPIKFPGLVVN